MSKFVAITTRYMAVGLAFVALIVAFIFLFIYDRSYCYQGAAYSSWVPCPPNNNRIWECNVPAVALRHFYIPNSGTQETYDVLCGWRYGTSTMGYIALSLAVVFVILCAVASKVDSIYYGLPVVSFGFLCTFGVATTFALMVTDINDGHHPTINNTSILNNRYYWTQVPFIINTAAVFLVLLALVVLVVCIFYTHIQKNYKQLVGTNVVVHRETLPVADFRVHDHHHHR